MIIAWFKSSSVRQAVDLLRRVRRTVRAQRDLLSPAAITNVDSSCAQLDSVIRSGASKEEVKKQALALETTAQKWLKPYAFPRARENVDVVLVALTVALAIRTFFLQPMAIPTGSMQPTLYGITSQSLKGTSQNIPNFFSRIFQAAFGGVSYYHVVAKSDGQFLGAEPPRAVLPFVKYQRFKVGGEIYKVWFPPDEMFDGPHNRTGIVPGQSFKAGEDIIKLKVIAGDRLFVDRFTYNFRHPRRGEIVIFASTGIPMLTQNTHYIKRLIGLPNETLRIGDDRHVLINNERLDASTPRFENVYSFTGDPADSVYSGHVNDFIGMQFAPREDGQPLVPAYAPLFPNEKAEYKVSDDRYFAMGDNTMNSYDSRYWGDFPQEKVVGRFSFVFWPFSERFGWAVR